VKRLAIISPFVGALVLASVAAAAVNPKPFVLRLVDMPSGFAATTSHYVSAQQAAKDGPTSIAQFREWGYLTGYEATYTQNGGLADLLAGAGQILSSVSVYKSAGGAASSWTESDATCLRHKPQCTRLALNERIGDQAGLYKVAVTSKKTKVISYVVVWRRGALKGSIIAAGVGVGPSVQATVALAVKQDKRMVG
jgi:hypothetical protein